ncbi:uncharacterized protein BJ212DRAFT_779264 [Suillus subaureus]|uniref:Uncharacterized protein n=1 Tax=Suillus subaureus TaxID=48587 RepID=A0A9P7DZF7_9AGAM|nr:uncharacterized protein BJ212DRAFT_779264 [Suillus subaureus]KAG1807026.1 hypothetical protein BJ212DRAFT_779264 [Suillus subaureus]
MGCSSVRRFHVQRSVAVQISPGPSLSALPSRENDIQPLVLFSLERSSNSWWAK